MVRDGDTPKIRELMAFTDPKTTRAGRQASTYVFTRITYYSAYLLFSSFINPSPDQPPAPAQKSDINQKNQLVTEAEK